MGKIGFIERLPLKRQLILTFVWIMLLSVVCTIITIGIGMWWLSKSSWIQPANTYESQLPEIAQYVRSQHALILNPDNRAELEKRVPADGIQYQVVTVDGKPLYGTLREQKITTRDALINGLNKTVSAGSSMGFGGRFLKIVPVTSVDGDLKGAILFQYKLEVSGKSGSGFNWANLAMILIFLVSPFLYIAIFTYLFAAKFGRRIARPVHELIEASQRIRNQDLDFTVSYKADNELGMLTESFENMRGALKSSLLREWKLEQERRDMMDAIAHDFRTPMTIIQGNVELLADTPDMIRSRAEVHLKVIEDNIQRVNRLIQDVQIASEKDMEYFPLRGEEVILEDFLRDKEREVGYICHSHRAEYSFEYEVLTVDPMTPVYMDVQRVSQVLDNLIANSIRYLPSEAGWLGVRVQRQSSALLFEICDNGPGFKDQDIPHLFEKFYRGEKGQTGLGLYTAQIIAEKHGGSIRALNRKEGGACMVFTIRTDASGLSDVHI
ncbi:HAMP domain-containing sensor histidine kinase [Paenibacillus dokdonensis]|uniref:histidine kinase n=1 Tax=Paenibacillus dokdonensis TaxID=2567944 RepID=A0ABU6GR80_9BACL|nr:HAMP domain-containing sensor histidine kinase [Paenibacillus dokdonensis]MEC0242281.1 HAMP domain-containing sensor histidine kinase [Paenibacillus dokdonensis]